MSLYVTEMLSVNDTDREGLFCLLVLICRFVRVALSGKVVFTLVVLCFCVAGSWAIRIGPMRGSR